MPGLQVLDYVNSPASEAAQRQPQLTTSWVQRFGLPLYATSVGDNDFDFAVPVLRSGGVDPSQAKLIGADGIVPLTTASNSVGVGEALGKQRKAGRGGRSAAVGRGRVPNPSRRAVIFDPSGFPLLPSPVALQPNSGRHASGHVPK